MGLCRLHLLVKLDTFLFLSALLMQYLSFLIFSGNGLGVVLCVFGMASCGFGKGRLGVMFYNGLELVLRVFLRIVFQWFCVHIASAHAFLVIHEFMVERAGRLLHGQLEYNFARRLT